MEIRQRIGLRIKAIRRQKGLSQSDLATLMTRSVDTVSAIERGKSLPNLETLEAFAAALKSPIRDLFDFSDEGETPKSEKVVAELLAIVRQMPERQLALCLELVKAVYQANEK